MSLFLTSASGLSFWPILHLKESSAFHMCSRLRKNRTCNSFSRVVLAAICLWYGVGVQAQEAVVAPPENLVVEGVPKVPASLAETAGRYGEYRYAGLADWHPTKRNMLISTRFAETPQSHAAPPRSPPRPAPT